MPDENHKVHAGLAAIANAFAKETDRAAAIVAAAMLDDSLANLLEALLVRPDKDERSIVRGDQAPLGTFSARINAAHQLGLISRYFVRDLHLIRKIRNDFAHNPQDLSFDTSSVKGRVAALESSGFNRRNAATRTGLGPPGPRGDFLGIVSWMLFSLQEDVSKTKRLSGPVAEFAYIDWDGKIEALANTDQAAQAGESLPALGETARTDAARSAQPESV